MSHNAHHRIGGVAVAHVVGGTPTENAHALRPPTGVKRQTRKLGLHLPASATPYVPRATKVDLSAQHPPVKDQGGSGACTTHSFTSGVHAALVCAGVASPIDGSPHTLYSLSGRVESPTGPLQDDGRQLVDVLVAATTSGLSPMRAPTPDGRNSDIWTANDTSAEPPNVCLDLTPEETASLTPVVPPGYVLSQATIDPSGPDVGGQVCACLDGANGPPAPVWLGTQVGAAFQGIGGNQLAQPDPANDPQGGGHALEIAGYWVLDAASAALYGVAPGTVIFLVRNSWGESWDANGECWASLAWVAACWELRPLTVVATSGSS